MERINFEEEYPAREPTNAECKLENGTWDCKFYDGEPSKTPHPESIFRGGISDVNGIRGIGVKMNKVIGNTIELYYIEGWGSCEEKGGMLSCEPMGED